MVLTGKVVVRSVPPTDSMSRLDRVQMISQITIVHVKGPPRPPRGRGRDRLDRARLDGEGTVRPLSVTENMFRHIKGGQGRDNANPTEGFTRQSSCRLLSSLTIHLVYWRFALLERRVRRIFRVSPGTSSWGDCAERRGVSGGNRPRYTHFLHLTFPDRRTSLGRPRVVARGTPIPEREQRLSPHLLLTSVSVILGVPFPTSDLQVFVEEPEVSLTSFLGLH